MKEKEEGTVMKKTTIGVSFDEEKTTATRLYMKQKNMSLEEELAKAMETIYTRNVPSGVREFIDMRTGAVITATPIKEKGKGC